MVSYTSRVLYAWFLVTIKSAAPHTATENGTMEATPKAEIFEAKHKVGCFVFLQIQHILFAFLT
jgi:hypothetical protein